MSHGEAQKGRWGSVLAQGAEVGRFRRSELEETALSNFWLHDLSCRNYQGEAEFCLPSPKAYELFCELTVCLFLSP